PPLHLHLPPFPTRRSSDLGNGCRCQETAKTQQTTFLRQVEAQEKERNPEYDDTEGLLPSHLNKVEIVTGIVRGGNEQHIEYEEEDRKSTRLNSSHVKISYA